MNDKSSRRQSCYLVFGDLQQTPYQYYNIQFLILQVSKESTASKTLTIAPVIYVKTVANASTV